MPLLRVTFKPYVMILQSKLPFCTRRSQQGAKQPVRRLTLPRLFLAVGFVLSGGMFAGPALADQQSGLPFWPDFPEDLNIKPTQVEFDAPAPISGQADNPPDNLRDNPVADPFQSDLKIRGEGPGFLILAASVDHVVFASAPRMNVAWQVACRGKRCDVSQIRAQNAMLPPEETPAFQAAVRFAESRAETPAKSRTETPAANEPTTLPKQPAGLPPISILLGTRVPGSR